METMTLMKLTKIFTVVLFLHALFFFLVIQPGCQTNRTPSRAASETSGKPPPSPPAPVPSRQQPLHPDFNAGMDKELRDPSRPVRPKSPVYAEDSEVLQPLEALEPAAEETLYVVARGDSLWNIAKKHDVPLNDLLAANGLAKDSVIIPGQELIIPAGAKVPEEAPPAAAGESYTVQRGDNLTRIARKFGVGVSALKTANRLTSDTIYSGQKLVIPERGAGAPPPPPPKRPQPQADDGAHVVQPGETPAGIAKRYGIQTEELMRANNIADARKMQAGQKLVIPGGAMAQPPPPSVESSSKPVIITPQPRETAATPEMPPSVDDLESMLAEEEKKAPAIEVIEEEPEAEETPEDETD